jgi:hypothetical protein
LHPAWRQTTAGQFASAEMMKASVGLSGDSIVSCSSPSANTLAEYYLSIGLLSLLANFARIFSMEIAPLQYVFASFYL